MSVQDIMDRLKPRFLAKWRERLTELVVQKPEITAEDAYKAGYWDGVVDGVDVGVDGGVIHPTPAPESILQ